MCDNSPTDIGEMARDPLPTMRNGADGGGMPAGAGLLYEVKPYLEE